MTIAVDLGRKATKQTNKQTIFILWFSYFQYHTQAIFLILPTFRFGKDSGVGITEGQYL